MKLFVSLLFLSLDVSRAFTPHAMCARHLVSSVAGSGIHSTPEAETTDQYDEWYEDFDPSAFEGSDEDTNASSGDVGHDYERDTSEDNSDVDVEAVNYLLAERLIMKKSRRFDEADAIRDELVEKHGVMVRDREGTWRSGWGAAGRRNGRRSRQLKDFGPNGHDYNLAENAGPSQSTLSEPEIHQKLAERLQCKLKRDYNTADRLQAELLKEGVVLNDKKRLWRADGAAFDEFAPRQYSQSEHSKPSTDADQIQAMVTERSKAKSERLYSKADQIRDTLFDQFQVSIDDKRAEWSVGGDFGEPQRRNQRTFTRFEKAPGCPESENDDAIQKLLDDRDAARATRKFDVADAIREELMGMNIFVDDRNRQWSFGRGTGSKGSGYTRRGEGSLSDDTLAEITSLLDKRSEHKRNRKFKSADKIRDQLRDTFNVLIDDKNKEWQAVTGEYTMSSTSAPVSEEVKKVIHELVEQRAVAKLQRDYATADSVRDLLGERYNVSVDDRVKEWCQDDDAPDSDEERQEEMPAAAAVAEEVEDDVTNTDTTEEGLGETIPDSTEEL
ncbi:MAG: hypothetical protein SGBAC_008224 [Bacillariaceae sp.]